MVRLSLVTKFTNLVLTSLGDKLSDDEAEELMKLVHVGKDSRIDYQGASRP